MAFRLIQSSYTDLLINNGTLDFANKIKTIDHIGLILSRIHIHPMPHVSSKFGNDIQQINIATILVQRYKKMSNDEKNVMKYTGMHC